MTAARVLRRELLALIRLPQTYAIAATFLVISGIFFVNILISTEVADLSAYYSNIASTLLVLVPVAAMRSFAEERRSGALDISLSWPASRTGTVLGKLIANTALVWALTSSVWLYFTLVGHVAAIPAGRTAGGYVGLLLMSMAFSALALMVSARAASTTAAAFLGFGLLLFLWVLEYAPGWIGRSLRSLGPAGHFEAFPRGVVYWEDVTYFLLLTVIGVVLSVAALDRERPGRHLGSLVRRGSALGLVLVVWFSGSALATSVEGKVDLTASKQNTLTDATRKVLQRLRGPLHLTGFAQPLSNEEANLRALVKQYRAAGADITMEIVDPDVQPARARRVGAGVYGQILVELGRRQELIKSATEGALTSAIHRLTAADDSRRLCLTIGHGERSLTDETASGLSALARELRSKLFFDVQPLALSLEGADQQLSKCTVTVVAGPKVPLLPAEMALLDAYAHRDGRLIIMADGVEGPRQQLNELLAPWGAAFGQGVVSDLSALAKDPASVVSASYPSGSPATEHLQDAELPVVFPNAAPIEQTPGSEDENGSFTALVTSSAKSWVDIAVSGTGSSRLPGPFNLAAVLDRSRVFDVPTPSVSRTRIGVLASADVASNRGLELFGNGQFVAALVQWVAWDDDLIAAVRPSDGPYKLVLTEGQKSRLVRQGIVLPCAVVLVPLPIVLLRLRRG